VPAPVPIDVPQQGPATQAPTNAAALGPGVHLFKECEVCPVMAVVPAGQAWIGSPPEEAGRSANEGPQQAVAISQPFAVGRSEVTFEEWFACLAEGGCNAHRPGDFGFGTGKYPVIFVSWQDAKAYVAWLSRKTGASYRLLSEAEWEFAARGCAIAACPAAPFWFGRDIAPERANYNWSLSYNGSPKAQRQARTVPADAGAANPFGLLHVHGNVREWVEDCWNDNLVGLPSSAAARTTGDCTRRVVKGGSWADEPRDLRLAKRDWEVATDRQERIGFRVARALSR
jgi:formylglycine-generating enzyme required for sulfatase activity